MWSHVPRAQSLWYLCKNGVGDEFPFFFQSDMLKVLRVRQFGANFCGDISILNNPHFSCQLAAHCYQVFKISLRCS